MHGYDYIVHLGPSKSDDIITFSLDLVGGKKLTMAARVTSVGGKRSKIINFLP